MISASLSLSLPRLGWKSTSMPRSLKICTAAGDNASEMRTLGFVIGLIRSWSMHLSSSPAGLTRGSISSMDGPVKPGHDDDEGEKTYAALASDDFISENAQSIHCVSSATS